MNGRSSENHQTRLDGRVVTDEELVNVKKRKILVLGSGALKIGQSGEFDYSGTQALKALREEGCETVLINPNVATVQTTEGIADRVYYLPVTPEWVEMVIRRERPDGIMLAFGGQTALNCGVSLARSGTLERYGVRVLGTPVEAIIRTEDRDLFAAAMHETDAPTPRSVAVTTPAEALEAAKAMGYPVMVRAAYALGGLGSGFCRTDDELTALVGSAFSYAPQVLVEESLQGWKEIEYEVVRDRYDNCVTVCNMENIDPLGIHTGESIVAAPSQTLSDAEYHLLRRTAIRIVRQLGIVGECNVQYALDPDGREGFRVIEVNARLSRSSALASKATGYPLAFVAAKLALGYGLDELPNSVTGVTTACFEPALDYVALKLPRWDLGKFSGVSHLLGSSMKSVGEVMAIGRTFEEALQKGMRMVGQGLQGFEVDERNSVDTDKLDNALSAPTDKRLLAIAQAFEQGYTVERLHGLTHIDPWFLSRMENIHRMAEMLRRSTASIPPTLQLRLAKQLGFSDSQIGRLTGKSEDSIRRIRKEAGIVPVVKQIDTLAGEYPARTNYLYLTYHGTTDDIAPLPREEKGAVIVLGSGAYRIGSSVEFDWCEVSAIKRIRERGYRAVTVNCNPETVSTDYDMSDRLYFEELTLERVLDICEVENPRGVVVSVGGQTPNTLAPALAAQGVPLLGTSASSIDMAEDRGKFSALCDRLGIGQPRWRELTSTEAIREFVREVGWPVMIRPSYVLSGAAMRVVSNEAELENALRDAAAVSSDHPVVVTEFIERAKEVEIDAVAQDGQVKLYAISEHVEFAGVHSGDATVVFPAQKLYVGTLRQVKRITRQIAGALHISGPFNIQFLAKDGGLRVIECNLRASRSMPFVSKMTGHDFIALATDIMLGEQSSSPAEGCRYADIDYVGVKVAQFSFARLLRADPVLGVDMASTGEAVGMGDTFHEALLKGMLSVGYRIPRRGGGILLSSGPAESKVELTDAARKLANAGYRLYATSGTAAFLTAEGITDITVVHWPDSAQKPNVMEYLTDGRLDLVVNIPKNHTPRELENGYRIRRTAIDHNVPLITNARLAAAFIEAFCKVPIALPLVKHRGEYGY